MRIGVDVKMFILFALDTCALHMHLSVEVHNHIRRSIYNLRLAILQL